MGTRSLPNIIPTIKGLKINCNRPVNKVVENVFIFEPSRLDLEQHRDIKALNQVPKPKNVEKLSSLKDKSR